MLYELLHLTRDLGDAEFETTVGQLRAARRAAREAVAVERQMHTATQGISTRRALEAATPSDVKLVRQYVSAGLTPAEAEAKVRDLT